MSGRSCYTWWLGVTLVFISLVPIYPNSPAHIKKLLDYSEKSNKFIDVCLTNLPGSDQSDYAARLYKQLRKQFKLALYHRYRAKIWQLQGNYRRASFDLEKSLDLTKKIFSQMLIYYIDTTHLLLEEGFPLTIRSDDKFAEYYISTGYRHLGAAQKLYIRGHNINHSLHSNQINLFQQGFDEIRTARKYAILGLIESNLPQVEKPEFKKISLNIARDIRSGNRKRRDIYKWKLNKIINLTGSKLMPLEISKTLGADKSINNKNKELKVNLLITHQDNYKKIILDRSSLRADLIKEVFSEGLQAEPLYPERNSENRLEFPRFGDSAPILSESLKADENSNEIEPETSP